MRFGGRWALHQAVHVLGDRIVGQLRRHVVGAHALAALRPGLAAVLGEPDAAGRDRDPDPLRVARIDDDRMQAGQIGAATHPHLALGVIPQRAHHLPDSAVVARPEQSAGQRAAPDHAGLVRAAGHQRPDARRAPGQRPAPHVVLLEALGLRRIGRCRDLLPTVGGRAMHLDAEMAVVERGIVPAVARIGQRQGDVVAEEVGAFDRPAGRVRAPPGTDPCASKRAAYRSCSTSGQSLEDIDAGRLRRPDRTAASDRG